MSSPVYGPEILTSPTTDRITTAAEKIISVLGVITPRYGRRTLQARVSMDTSEFMEIPDTAFPLLTITKPLGDVAERALFKYAFLYVPHFSKLANTQVVLFAGDTPAGRIEHPGNADGVPLMEPEALKLAADLEKIAEI